MAYVGMSRGKDDNHVFIYRPITGEADHEHGQVATGAGIHTIRRGNKYSAAYHLRAILANDDRPRTMHTQAERTDRELLTWRGLGPPREPASRAPPANGPALSYPNQLWWLSLVVAGQQNWLTLVPVEYRAIRVFSLISDESIGLRRNSGHGETRLSSCISTSESAA